MSFGEKIAALMERPGQDPVAKDDVPWYLRYGGRILGSAGGFLAIPLGMMNCINVLFGDIGCFVGGAWQVLLAVLVVSIEAPCCCMFVDFIQQISDMVEKRPYWNRAAGYCALAVPPVIMCFNFSSLIGCGLIFGTGVLYGMMALGKKASLDEMRIAAQAAASGGAAPATSSNMRSTLVENAQPIGFSVPPDGNV